MDKHANQRHPWFTVFTPTYNRATLLPKAYAALLAQTMQDFEWLIVDDGSVDKSQLLIEDFQREARITIRYFRKDNGGAHTAHNLGVQKARGALFLRLDSDDTCVPQTLELLLATWLRLPPERRKNYSGVSCLSMNEAGKVLGDRYPRDEWVSTYQRLQSLKGEKWGFHRTDILLENQFPEFAGERFCPEGLIWGRVHEKYPTFCINVPLRIYETSANSLSHRMTRIRHKARKGVELYYAEQLRRLRGGARMRCCVNYVRFSESPFRAMFLGPTNPVRALVIFLAPLSLALRLRDRMAGDY